MGGPDELVLAACEGDRVALETLLQEFGPRVEAEIARKINPKWQSVLSSEDVMQVTYIEAFQQIGNLRKKTPDGFLAWLRTAANNNLKEAIQGLQADKRPNPENRIHAPKNQDSIVFFQNLLEESTTAASGKVAWNDFVRWLEVALLKLPRDYATVLRLLYFEGKTAGEAAEQMGRSRGAVYMLCMRAIDALRKLIERDTD
ncbi:MAG: RNA polymerase sigma factor [Phycisphaerales bacterium]|nr:RNA polymerase sigma factor [Phycisphaerales bacterium]